MFTCYYCGQELNDNMKSEEHIFPDSCGGCITTYNVCSTCNSKANTQFDAKFCDQEFIGWDRALKGIRGKRGDKHFIRMKTVTEDDQDIMVEISEEGIKPVVIPNTTWSDDSVHAQVDPRFYEQIVKDLKRKAEKKGATLNIPDSVPLVQQWHPGYINFGLNIDLNVVRREQLKILLGIGCSIIGKKFVNSETATLIRNYLWSESTPPDKIDKPICRLYPQEVKDNFPPEFVTGHRWVSPVETSLRIISYLQEEDNHVAAVFPCEGFVTIYINVFGRFHAYVTTIEPDYYYWPRPCPPPDGYMMVNDPKLRQKRIVNFTEKRNGIRISETAKLAGFLSKVDVKKLLGSFAG